MSFCFLYNVVSENYSVQNSPWGEGGGKGGGGGSIGSSRSKLCYSSNKTRQAFLQTPLITYNIFQNK